MCVRTFNMLRFGWTRFGIQAVCFVVSVALHTEKITDLMGSLTFVLLAVLTMVLGAENDPLGYTKRRITLTAIIAASRTELALFLWYRVVKRGKDARFDEIRSSFWKFAGFYTFFSVWIYSVSVSVIYLNTERIAEDTITGIERHVAGFLFEAVADIQKYRFRANPDNAGFVCTTGLWAWSRHPNYFGEIVGWWGVATFCSPLFNSPRSSFGYIALVSPVATMLFLLLLSGLPAAEGPALAKYMKTEEAALVCASYHNRTSIVIPLPPSWYVKFKPWAKILLFDLPMFAHAPEMESLITPMKLGTPVAMRLDDIAVT